jgi:hypothetical protein
MSTMMADQLYVIAKPSGHGGYSQRQQVERWAGLEPVAKPITGPGGFALWRSAPLSVSMARLWFEGLWILKTAVL